MATFYNVMLYGGLALAIVFAIIAVILFIKLNIPKVMGDLTGSTAKKQIQEIREKGYESIQGAGASKKDAIKSATNTGRISARDIKSSDTSNEEEYLKSIHEDSTDVLYEGAEEATDVLSENAADGEATDVLLENDGEATDVLTADDTEATDVLTADDTEATDVLTADDTEATDVLTADDTESTDILSSIEDDADSTDVLTSEDADRSDAAMTSYSSSQKEVKTTSVKKILDIIVVHTEEEI